MPDNEAQPPDSAEDAARCGNTHYRGEILHFTDDPGDSGYLRAPGVEYIRDGVLVVGEDGRVKSVCRWPTEIPAGEAVVNYSGHLLVPGFVETHIHSGQVDVVAAYSKQMISWLKNNIFPREAKFANEGYACEANGFFLDTLLAAGTTTASVFTTMHECSAETLFKQATRRNMRILAGKVLMDNPDVAPDYLRDKSAAIADEQTRRLIEKWHGCGRNIYSIALRFALSSTDEQLRLAGKLYQDYSQADLPLWLHTHLSETREEVEMVRKRFGTDYLLAYDNYGLVGPRTIFGHSVWVTDCEIRLLKCARAAAAFCPTSNLFLGSGLFQLHKFLNNGNLVGMGTDMGGGNGYSMLRVMEEAYKVVGVGNSPRCIPESEILPDDRRNRLSPLRAFYLATLGGARALHLDSGVGPDGHGFIGNFAPGREADFVVLDWNATPTLRRRVDAAEKFKDDCHSPPDDPHTPDERAFLERLFALMMLGDERCTLATYVNGVRRYCREASPFPPIWTAEYRPPAQ